MKNNKNRSKDRPKSYAQLRKMQPRDNADLGIEKKKLHENGSEK